MKIRLLFLLQTLFGSLVTFDLMAQECGNCKITPRIANYDLRVDVPKLADTGDAMMQWRLLFWLGRHANAYLFDQNKNCVRFNLPIYADESGDQTLLIGETNTLLVGSGNVSEFGDYLLTGSVSNNNGSGNLHLELQTTCSRKTVAATDAPFNFSTESSYLIGIAHRAASQLTPLIDKIRQFELKEREENQQVAISGFFSDQLILKPKKTRLMPGEETEFELEIKDCDGVPLKGMEIEFSKSSIKGFNIEGTKGGIVTPSKVRTDASGKARAKFKMNNGARTATINAHAIIRKPNGCEDAFVGSVEISSAPHLRIDLDYQLYESRKMGLTSQTNISTVEVGKESSSFIRNHRTTLYYYPASGKGDVNANIFPKPIPGFSDGSSSYYASDAGFYIYDNNALGNKGREKMIGSGYSEKDTVISNSGNADAGSRPEIHFNIIKNELKNFSIEFNYPGEIDNENAHPEYPGGFIIESDDPGAIFTSRKIADPNNKYKTEYKVILKRKIDRTVSGLYKSSGLEELNITILSTY